MRSLGKKGINSISADVSRYGMCQFSRFSKGSVSYNSHYKDEVSFIRDIQGIIEANKISLVIPTHNETEILARNIENFSSDVTAIIPSAAMCHMGVEMAGGVSPTLTTGL